MGDVKLTQSFFAVLKNLADHATRGPWRLTTSGDAHWLRDVRDSVGSGIAFCGHFPESQAHADACYIAAVSPDVVLAMVAEVERLAQAEREAGDAQDRIAALVVERDDARSLLAHAERAIEQGTGDCLLVDHLKRALTERDEARAAQQRNGSDAFAWEVRCTDERRRAEAAEARVAELEANLPIGPSGDGVVCDDHSHGLSGETVDGSTGCPWCHVAELQCDRDDADTKVAAAEARVAELEAVVAETKECCEDRRRTEQERDAAVRRAELAESAAFFVGMMHARDEARAALAKATEKVAILERIADAAADAEKVLALCKLRTFPAPEDAEVRRLGEHIGFGALMSAAEKTWREWLVAQGMPVGSEFVAGPCRATVEGVLATLRAALAARGKDGG